MKRVLVTGGAGAIGVSLVTLLLERGYEVLVWDDLSSGREEFLPKGANFLRGSILDLQSQSHATSWKPQVVVHLAARFANQNSVDNPRADLSINGDGTLAIYELFSTPSVERIVYASSSCVYGNHPLMHEAHVPTHFDTPYAITKYLGELYARFMFDLHQTPIVVARIFNNYGPGELPGKYRNVIPNFFKAAASNAPLTITGDGTETRDFNYVFDTSSHILKLIEGPLHAGKTFNLASGTSTSIQSVAEAINRITGNTSGVVHVPARNWDHVKHRKGDTRLFADTFGPPQTTPLEVGLENTWRWLKTYHHLWKE